MKADDPISNPADFYDALSDQYDFMTDRAGRVSREAELLLPLVREEVLRSAADMGCGTGVHVHALASLGVRATGFDISEGMLKKARESGDYGGNAVFVRGDFLAPALADSGPWDAVFCLGNSLPHLKGPDALRETFAYWRMHLNERGLVIAQALNFNRVLQSGERIVGIRRDAAGVIVRFYDFTRPRITFNILSITGDSTVPSHTLRSTLLCPFTREDLREAALSAGFESVRFFSTLRRDEWSEDSRDTVMIARQAPE